MAVDDARAYIATGSGLGVLDLTTGSQTTYSLATDDVAVSGNLVYALDAVAPGRPVGVLNRGGTIQLHDLRCFAKADAWEALDDIGDHLRRLFHARRLDLSVGGCVSCLANGPVDIDDGITTGVSGSVVSLTVTTRD